MAQASNRLRSAGQQFRGTVTTALKRQYVLLLVVIITAVILDQWLGQGRYILAVSATLGALLSVTAQTLFSWALLRHSGYHARQRVVKQMYKGQLIKWLVTLVGFTLIFITIRPLSALALLIGFMVMQISNGWMLWQLR